jgi:transcriptional regulator with XRE-family HTH domain
MSKSAFTDAHRILVQALAHARREAGIHQADLAAKIGKDQSYISNIERGQRRVDVIEFYTIVKAMNADPVDLFSRIARALPDTINI